MSDLSDLLTPEVQKHSQNVTEAIKAVARLGVGVEALGNLGARGDLGAAGSVLGIGLEWLLTQGIVPEQLRALVDEMLTTLSDTRAGLARKNLTVVKGDQ